MKVAPVSMPQKPPPVLTIEVFRDTNGNYFGSVDVSLSGSGRSILWTETYSTPAEAVEDAVRRATGHGG